jgi:VacB/RNase II family 3'-5' exoribonuclease
MDAAPTSKVDLQAAAKETMLKNGFEPDFSPAVRAQLSALSSFSFEKELSSSIRDLRHLLWSSIDNDTSRDLDQIEYAEQLPNGEWKVFIGIADVDSLVPKQSAIDDHAAGQTTSVYTGIEMFPMLPEQLSTGATSLLEAQDRLCIVIEFVVGGQGTIGSVDCYLAAVQNKAQLAYNAVGSWLDGKSTDFPEKVKQSVELQAQLKLQDAIAQALRKERVRLGALEFQTIEAQPIVKDGEIVGLGVHESNAATELIENFMIAANEVVARILENAKSSSIRRVVKTPARWDRIVALASTHGGQLPAEPNSAALSGFLNKAKSTDPEHFADLSLAVIKLMGAGEYALQRFGDPEQGHFGLAVQDYTHSTAPNRRFADLVTQRLLKAVIKKAPPVYSDSDLDQIANHCTERENAARKVEREMNKRIAAVAMQDKVGATFDAVVTGVTAHGVFARVLRPHCEGMVVRGQQGLDVGDRIQVRLLSTDVKRGFIDFARV